METLIGEVVDFFAHVEAAAINLKKSLNLGDKIKIKGGETEFEQTVESMQIHNKPVKSAKPGEDVGLKVSQKVRKGYKVYKI